MCILYLFFILSRLYAELLYHIAEFTKVVEKLLYIVLTLLRADTLL